MPSVCGVVLSSGWSERWISPALTRPALCRSCLQSQSPLLRNNRPLSRYWQHRQRTAHEVEPMRKHTSIEALCYIIQCFGRTVCSALFSNRCHLKRIGLEVSALDGDATEMLNNQINHVHWNAKCSNVALFFNAASCKMSPKFFYLLLYYL